MIGCLKPTKLSNWLRVHWSLVHVIRAVGASSPDAMEFHAVFFVVVKFCLLAWGWALEKVCIPVLCVCFLLFYFWAQPDVLCCFFPGISVLCCRWILLCLEKVCLCFFRFPWRFFVVANLLFCFFLCCFFTTLFVVFVLFWRHSFCMFCILAWYISLLGLALFFFSFEPV